LKPVKLVKLVGLECFSSGDVVTGAKTVVEAVRISKIVANAMVACVHTVG